MSKKAFIRYLNFFLLITIVALGCESLPVLPLPEIPVTQIVRVAVVQDAGEVLVKIPGAYRIEDLGAGEILEEGPYFHHAKVSVNAQGLHLEGRLFQKDRIRFISKKDIVISLARKTRSYHGDIDVIRNPANQKLTVINRLDVEQYIKGVLYHEVSDRWPMEALKAQAVAARTYAFYQMEANVGKEFDVTNDIYSQVYGGRGGERYRTNLAVERTQGETLYSRDKILPTYFHATCGGMTEDVRELWAHKDLLPLSGVRCRFCWDSPHFSWKKSFRSRDVQEKLNTKGYALGLIKNIRILERDPSDRIRNLEIETRDGKKVVISGKDFRNAVGPNDVRSNNYDVTMKGYYFDLIGKGWGHGVGLCQWGARGMAKQRYSYREILSHYYPGAVIRTPLRTAVP